jgi:hypothetical protein
MDDPLFIEDGFTRSHTIPAVAGLHPEVKVEYRPALAKERTAYGAKTASKDVDAIDRHECDLIARHVLKINGEEKVNWKEKVGRLHPTVRNTLIDLVLSYTAAKEAGDLGNSPGG